MENWETCVRFCFSYFPCCCCQARPRGRVYGSTSATKKIYFRVISRLADTPVILTTAKSQAKINCNIQTFD